MNVGVDLLKSGLQKYIRRGMMESALLCASKMILYSTKKQRLWNSLLDRLMIICGEDIGIGNITVVYNVLLKLFEMKESNNQLPYEKKYEFIKPIICTLCDCDKTREYAHIYYAVYEGDKYKPVLNLDECIDAKNIGIIYWFKYFNDDKNQIILNIMNKENNEHFSKLSLLCLNIAKTINENVWFYGLILLTYCYNLKFTTDPIDFSTNSIEYKGDETIEFDDFVIDKHTTLGRQLGKDLKYFVHVGSIVYPESKYTTEEYKKIHDNMYG